MTDEVWEKALSDARERAAKNLKPLGMRIESVFAVSPVGFLDINAISSDLEGRPAPTLQK